MKEIVYEKIETVLPVIALYIEKLKTYLKVFKRFSFFQILRFLLITVIIILKGLKLC